MAKQYIAAQLIVRLTVNDDTVFNLVTILLKLSYAHVPPDAKSLADKASHKAVFLFGFYLRGSSPVTCNCPDVYISFSM